MFMKHLCTYYLLILRYTTPHSIDKTMRQRGADFTILYMELGAVLILKSSLSLDLMFLLLCNSTTPTHAIIIYINTYGHIYLPVFTSACMQPWFPCSLMKWGQCYFPLRALTD